MTLRASRGGILAALLAVPLLTGCTSGAPDATAVPSPSEAPPSSSADPTTVPAPEPTPVVTCDTVLSTDGYARLAANGLEPREAMVMDPLAMQMEAAGGVACEWGKPQTDLVLTVVQLPVGSIDEATWLTALAEHGFTETGQPVAGAFTGPVEPGSGISPVAVLADGTLTFVNAPTYAELLAPAA